MKSRPTLWQKPYGETGNPTIKLRLLRWAPATAYAAKLIIMRAPYTMQQSMAQTVKIINGICSLIDTDWGEETSRSLRMYASSFHSYSPVNTLQLQEKMEYFPLQRLMLYPRKPARLLRR